MQGYRFGKPEPAAAITERIAAQKATRTAKAVARAG
jgi:hypothetical protein